MYMDKVTALEVFLKKAVKRNTRIFCASRKYRDIFLESHEACQHLYSLEHKPGHLIVTLKDDVSWESIISELNTLGYQIFEERQKVKPPTDHPQTTEKTEKTHPYSSRIEAAAHTANEKLGRPPTMDLVTFRLLGNVKDTQPIGMAYTANFDLIPSKLAPDEKTAYIIVENLAVLMHLTNKDLRFITDKYPQVVAIYANGLINKTCGAHSPKVTEWLANLNKTKDIVLTYFDFDFAGIDLAEKFSTAVNSGIVVPKWALSQARDDNDLTKLKLLSKQDAYQRQVKPLLENNLQKFDADSIFGEMRRVLFVHKLAVTQEHLMAHGLWLGVLTC